MKIIRVLTSILLLVVYLLPISLEASDFFMRLNECEQETSCCEIEVEKSCCNTKPTPKIIEKQHSECTDSILCQCCIENCNYQKSSHSPKNIGFNVININSLNIIKPIESKIIFKEKVENNEIIINSDILDNDVKLQKTFLELISLQYYSSKLG